MDLKLFHQVGAVSLDRLVADPEAFRDLRVRLALGDGAQDLLFSSREAGRMLAISE